jgi:hypothetical protein
VSLSAPQTERLKDGLTGDCQILGSYVGIGARIIAEHADGHFNPPNYVVHKVVFACSRIALLPLNADIN